MQYNFDLEAEIGHGLSPEELLRFVPRIRPESKIPSYGIGGGRARSEAVKDRTVGAIAHNLKGIRNANRIPGIDGDKIAGETRRMAPIDVYATIRKLRSHARRERIIARAEAAVGV